MASDAEKVMAEMYRKADALKVNEPGLTREQAFVRVLEAEPGLYQEYDDASREAARQAKAETDTKRTRRRGPRVGGGWDVRAWVDPQVYFLQCVFQVEPVVEAQLRDMIDLDEGVRTKALNKWSKNWHLGAAWCRRKGYALVADSSSVWPPPPPFIFECQGWTPLYPREVRAAQMRKAFDDALEKHMQERENYAKRQKWVAPGKMPNLAFFEYAARYQVKGESAETISKAVRPFRYELTETRFAADYWAASTGDKEAADRIGNRRNYDPAEIIPQAVQTPLPEGPLTRQAVEYGYHTVLKLIGFRHRPDTK